jgi:hypothetical protein
MESYETLPEFIQKAPLLTWKQLPNNEWGSLTEENYSGDVELYCHRCDKERIFTFVGRFPRKTQVEFRNDSPTVTATVLQCVNSGCDAQLKFVFERDTTVRNEDETEEARKIVRKLYHEPTYRTLYGKSSFIEAFSDDFEKVDRDNLKRADECFRDGYPAAALVYLRKFIESLLQEIYESKVGDDYIEWQSEDDGRAYSEQFSELGEHMPESLREHGQEVLRKIGSGLHLTYSEKECEKIYGSAVTFIVEVMKEMYSDSLEEDFHIPQEDLDVLVGDI